MAHLKELEEEVKWLRSKSIANQSTISHHSSTEDAGRQSDIEEPELSRGRLIVQGERSRYVGDEASVLLGDKVSLGFSYNDYL